MTSCSKLDILNSIHGTDDDEMQRVSARAIFAPRARFWGG